MVVNLIDDRATARHPGAMTDTARLLLSARRALAAELDADLAERGYPDLRPADTALFLAIDRRSGSRVTDLAEDAGVTKQAMMSLVDDLEARGYVRRVSDPSDGRAKLVRLTAHGRRATTECRRAVLSLEQRARRRVGDRRYELLREMLEELVTGAQG
jgi:DNA-binding MarR family transcriptional regulator